MPIKGGEFVMTRYAYALLFALTTMSGLAACSQDPDPAEGEQDGVAGLQAENARLILPAVNDNPAVVYFDLSYSGERPVMLRRVDVQGADSSQLHEMSEWSGEMVMGEMAPLRIADGDTVTFEPGAKHVMVFNPAATLQPGGQTEVTLTFVGGDKFSFPAVVQSAADDR